MGREFRLALTQESMHMKRPLAKLGGVTGTRGRNNLQMAINLLFSVHRCNHSASFHVAPQFQDEQGAYCIH